MLSHYDTTVLGRAIFAAARVFGPRRTLERMARNTRTANNFIETRVEPQPDGALLMTNSVVPEFIPAVQAQGYMVSSGFVRGMVTSILEILGVQGFSVAEVSSPDPLHGGCRVVLPR